MISYAGFWRRCAASLIDSVALMLLLALILGPAYVSPALFSLENLIQTSVTIALTVYLWIRFLGTPGKLLLGCQVVDASNYKPLSPRQALIRYLGYYVSLMPLGLGFFWIAWDKRKQGFHDKIANTVVVYNAMMQQDDESQKSLSRLIAELR